MTIILKLNSSCKNKNSYSKELTEKMVNELVSNTSGAEVIDRDLTKSSLPFLNGSIIEAISTPETKRTQQQKDVLAISDTLIHELQKADIYVIGVAMYNFAPPSVLKAWADLVARSGVTFRYTNKGPVGLLENKTAYIMISTGGTKVGGPLDYASTWMQSFLNFMGICNVKIIPLDCVDQKKPEMVGLIEEEIKKYLLQSQNYINHKI